MRLLLYEAGAGAEADHAAVLGQVQVTGLEPHGDGVSTGVVLLLLLLLYPGGRVRHRGQRLGGVVPRAGPGVRGSPEEK